MWRLMFVISLALFCEGKADSLVNVDDEVKSIPPIEPPAEPVVSFENLSKNSHASTSNLIKSQDSILNAASNIANAPNIVEMIKRMETFSRKFPAGLLKDKSLKPMPTKFKKSYDTLVVQTKPILRMARKLEKMDKNKNKKQLDAFAKKLTTLTKHIDSFTKSVNDDSRKQKTRNLKIIKNHRNDITAVENAKRFINMADTFSACLQWIQSIPNNINCMIFGNCEANNGSDDGDTNDDEDVGGGDDDEDDDGDDEVDDDIEDDVEE